MTIRLGATPEDLEVVLVAGQSWAVSLARKDATTGTPVDWTDLPELTFPDSGVTALATIGKTGDLVTLTLTSTQVDQVLAGGGRATLRLGAVLWARGWVIAA